MRFKTLVTSDPTLRPATASEKRRKLSPVLPSSWPRTAPDSCTHNAGMEFFQALCQCGKKRTFQPPVMSLTNCRDPRQILSRTQRRLGSTGRSSGSQPPVARHAGARMDSCMSKSGHQHLLMNIVSTHTLLCHALCGPCFLIVSSIASLFGLLRVAGSDSHRETSGQSIAARSQCCLFRLPEARIVSSTSDDTTHKARCMAALKPWHGLRCALQACQWGLEP